MRNQLPHTFDLMADFRRAMSLQGIYDILLKRCANRGVTSILAGVIPDRIIRPEEQPSFVVLGHWPQNWAERYFSKQYVVRDPTIKHSATHLQPLYWSDIDLTDRNDPAARIMLEAREYHLRDGVTIPQLTLDGKHIGVSFAGDLIDHSPDAHLEYIVMASYAVSRALEIRSAEAVIGTPLTVRQRECLVWASEGFTASEIGDRLGIATRLVERHLGTARERLGAKTTAQAVAHAIRLGVFS